MSKTVCFSFCLADMNAKREGRDRIDDCKLHSQHFFASLQNSFLSGFPIVKRPCLSYRFTFPNFESRIQGRGHKSLAIEIKIRDFIRVSLKNTVFSCGWVRNPYRTISSCRNCLLIIEFHHCNLIGVSFDRVTFTRFEIPNFDHVIARSAYNRSRIKVNTIYRVSVTQKRVVTFLTI